MLSKARSICSEELMLLASYFFAVKLKAGQLRSRAQAAAQQLLKTGVSRASSTPEEPSN